MRDERASLSAFRRQDYGAGGKDEEFVREWLRERTRPGFESRAGKPFTDWPAWADAIRRGWVTDDGWWVAGA